MIGAKYRNWRKQYGIVPICVNTREVIVKSTVVVAEWPIFVSVLNDVPTEDTAREEELAPSKHIVRAKRKDILDVQGIEELRNSKTLVAGKINVTEENVIQKREG